MDLCKYAYYKSEEKYFPSLYCNIDDKRCIYSKKCLKVEKFVPLENEMWRECYKFIMEKRKNIPKDSYFVQTYRPNKNGKLYLYVVIDDKKVERILSDFTEINQDYVYIKRLSNNEYKVSLTPFVNIQPKENVEQSTQINNKNIEQTTKRNNNVRKNNKPKKIKSEIIE